MARSNLRERTDLVDRFRHYLQDQRLPRTRQRDRIAEIVFASEAHPSAADIQRALAESDDHVGTATVYRTLELLIASGLVRAHDFGDGFKRYEATPLQQGHGHLICVRCGTVVEFTNDRLERMLPIISDEHAFVHQRHQVEIYGRCSACRKHDLEL
ncbi:MAG: Fur family transcriptional regulator [Gemmatimonadales bacterium]